MQVRLTRKDTHHESLHVSVKLCVVIRPTSCQSQEILTYGYEEKRSRQDDTGHSKYEKAETKQESSL